MPWALTIKDGLGTLGNTSTSRLARCVYYGPVGAQGSVYIPEFNGYDGIIYYSYQGGQATPIAAGWWNEATKTLSVQGGPYTIMAFMYRGARRYIGGFMGLTIVNANNEVIIDNRNRNAEIVSEGQIVLGSRHTVYTISYPAVDGAMLFLQMPEDRYMYIGAIRSNYAKIASQEDGVVFRYFVAGYRRDVPALMPGMALTMRRNGQLIFNSKRPYPRLYGLYGRDPFDMLPSEIFGNARTDVTVPYKSAPSGSYVMMDGISRAPNTVDSWWVWAFKKRSNVGGTGRDWITRTRHTMLNASTDALELWTGEQPPENRIDPSWSMIGGLS